MMGTMCLEKLLDFGISFFKPVSVLSHGEAVYFLSSLLENGFSPLPQVLRICSSFSYMAEASSSNSVLFATACWFQAS